MTDIEEILFPVEKTVFERSQGVFLDVSSCGSSVRWGVSVKVTSYRKDKKKYVNLIAVVESTDCTRAIKWDADESPTLFKKKVFRVINSLKAALRAVEKAEVVMRREKAKK